jgi:hypothetical protein
VRESCAATKPANPRISKRLAKCLLIPSLLENTTLSYTA